MTTSTSTRLGVVEEVTSGKCDMPDVTAAQKESLGRGHFYLRTRPEVNRAVIDADSRFCLKSRELH